MHHNHKKCQQAAISSAENICQKLDIRLTKSRKRVLEIIWQSHKATKAYDILEILAKEDKSAKPPTVYRALEFLQQNSLVHKIESLNAYVGCNKFHNDDEVSDDSQIKNHLAGSQFLICDKCGIVEEFFDKKIYDLIIQNAEANKFSLSNQIIEAHGVCSECQ